MMMNIPSDYRQGYDKAERYNSQLAARYISYITQGDSPADLVVKDLNPYKRSVSARFIKAALDKDIKNLKGAPSSLLEFVDHLSNFPDWFDPEMTLPACKMVCKNFYPFSVALVGGGLIEGFCTNISKSFMYTGRILEGNQAVRRLMQNNRHQLEIFLPNGLERHGEGWKLTVRVRLVHAQIRQLVRAQADWDVKAWGMPISAAHLALANTCFSTRVFKTCQKSFKYQIERQTT